MQVVLKPLGGVTLKNISYSYSSRRFRTLLWAKDTSSFPHCHLLGLSLGSDSHKIRGSGEAWKKGHHPHDLDVSLFIPSKFAFNKFP